MRTAPKDPAEVKIIRLEYGTEIEPGVTIQSVDVQVATVEGTDPTPGAFLAGAMVIDNAKLYGLQRVQGGIGGCAYEIRGLATDSNGLKHLVVATVPVEIEH